TPFSTRNIAVSSAASESESAKLAWYLGCSSRRSATMLRDGSVGVEATWCGTEGATVREAPDIEREAPDEERCEQLHRTLKRIVKARAALDAEEAGALREAERLRVWRHYERTMRSRSPNVSSRPRRRCGRPASTSTRLPRRSSPMRQDSCRSYSPLAGH